MLLMVLFGISIFLAASSGIPGLLASKHNNWLSTWLMIASATSGLLAAIMVLFGKNLYITFRHTALSEYGILHLDPIGAFFLIPVLVLSVCGSLFATKYWDEHNENSQQLQLLFGITTAFLIILTASAHTITFLTAWEGMAITAFMLIMTTDRDHHTRQAGFIYLVSTHIGTILLLAAFGLLYKTTSNFAFSNLAPNFANTKSGHLVFILFLLGFGFKAGIFPLHFWLPLAHSATPSHISSLMSGILIKMGILGLIRILCLIPNPPIWWGTLLIVTGICTGILGIALAMVQSDIKKLLAYCSIENIGIIFIGLGLGVMGKSIESNALQLLGFSGALLHILNHSLIKGLLFFGAGSIIHATNIKDIESLNGLIRTMPFTASAFLLGSWAICGLPPLNGFVGEWLIYLAALQGLTLPNAGLFALVLASLAVISSLSLACFTKIFGIIFLGRCRSSACVNATEAPKIMQTPMIILAALCIVIGLFPITVYPVLSLVTNTLVTNTECTSLSTFINLKIISYLALPSLVTVAFIWFWCNKNRAKDLEVSTWNCGYATEGQRTQYTASSLVSSLTLSMKLILRPKIHWRRIVVPFPSQHKYAMHIQDFVLDNIINPGSKFIAKCLSRLHFLQNGRLPLYLLYILLTLIVLMVWMLS